MNSERTEPQGKDDPGAAVDRVLGLQRWEEALALARGIVAALPDSADAHALLAAAHFANYDIDSGDAEALVAVSLNRDDAVRRLRVVARHLIAASRFEEAIFSARAAYSGDPDSLATFEVLADALVGGGLPDEAYATALHRMDDHPAEAAAHAWLGRAALAVDHKAHVKGSFEAAVRLDPTNVEYRMWLLRELVDNGDLARAVILAGERELSYMPVGHFAISARLAKLTVEKHPEAFDDITRRRLQSYDLIGAEVAVRDRLQSIESGAAQAFMVAILCAQGEFIEATPFCEAAIDQIGTDDLGIPSLVALRLFGERRLDEAKAQAAAVVNGSPFAVAAHWVTATIALDAREFDAAEAAARALIAIPWTSDLGRELLCLALLPQNGHLDDAAAVAKELLATRPDASMPNFVAGFALFSHATIQVERAAALQQLRRALPFDSAIGAYGGWRLLTSLSLELGHLDEAEDFARTAIAARPASADSHLCLATVFHTMGRTDEARQSMATAKRLDHGSVARWNAAQVGVDVSSGATSWN